MNGLEAIASMFRQLANNSGTFIADSIEETKGEFIELNKRQLLEGEKSDQTPLGFYKSKSYAIKKNRQNPLPGLGVKDYHLKGDYYRGITATIKNGKIEMTSTDSKTKWIEKDNDKRFGLNSSNLSIYVSQNLSPAIIKNILSQLKIQ